MSVRVEKMSMDGEGAILRAGGRERLHTCDDQIHLDGVDFQQCPVREVMDFAKNSDEAPPFLRKMIRKGLHTGK